MERMLIYVAGKLTDLAQGYIINLSKMCTQGTAIARAMKAEGVKASLYIPGEDFMRASCDGNYTRKELFDNSQGFLERADCMFVLSNWRTSDGTKAEIQSAKEKKVPVFYDLMSLVAFARAWKWESTCRT